MPEGAVGLIHSERPTLAATFLNGVAIALFAVGVLAPVIGFLTTGTGRGLVLSLICGSCASVSRVPTLDSEAVPRESARMSDFLFLLIVPVTGLIVGGAVFLLLRDRHPADAKDDR